MDTPAAQGRVVLEERQAQPILSIRATIAVAQLGDVMGERLTALSNHLRSHGITPAGPPFVRYHTFGETTTDMETGVPVGEPCKGDGPIVYGALPGGPAITTWHVGPHVQLGQAYSRIHAWLAENGRSALGAGWEVYPWIDLDEGSDRSAWSSPAEPHVQLVQPIERPGAAS
jgi:effector-binding domain-containing protein